MQECCICKRYFISANLVEAINDNQIIKICKSCSIKENIPLIKKPSDEQIQKSKQATSVYERLKAMAGIREKSSKKLEEEKIKELSRFIPNFAEEIRKAREKKNLTQEQLAKAIFEDKKTIEMLEKGILTNEKAINKIEQFLMIKIRKDREDKKQKKELIKEQKKQQKIKKEDKVQEKPEEEKKEIEVKGKKEEKIEEEDKKPVEIEDKAIEEKDKKADIEDKGLVELKKENLKELTIGDLKKMQEKLKDNIENAQS